MIPLIAAGRCAGMADLAPPKRIVTGHDADGRSVFVYDGPPPVIRTLGDGTQFHEMWITSESPPVLTPTEPEPISEYQVLGPPANGTRVRICDMPPGSTSPMHRTASVDYGVVIQGTVTLVLDDDQEVEIGPGGLIVQRGTDHSWQNRTSETVRMMFVLVDGRFDETLAALLPPEAVTHDVD
jgi:quercetin dioxygenase-like cupin family protein